PSGPHHHVSGRGDRDADPSQGGRHRGADQAMTGEQPLPDLPSSRPGGRLGLDDFEEAARMRLPGMVFDYYAGGAGDEWTLRENRRAFDRWVIRPRVLVDVSKVDPS